MKRIVIIMSLVLTSLTVSAQAEYGKEYIKRIGEKSSTYVSRRPAEKDRLFRSDVIDKKI